MSGVPDLKEELDRKAFETIEWLVSSYNAAKISKAQFSTGIDALFMAVNGLVDEGVNTLITESSNLAGSGEHSINRVFVKGAKAVVLTWRTGEELIRVVSFESGANKSDRKQEFPDCAAAQAAIGRLAATLLTSGYDEV